MQGLRHCGACQSHDENGRQSVTCDKRDQHTSKCNQRSGAGLAAHERDVHLDAAEQKEQDDTELRHELK